jgi:hypothetical protein
MKHSPHDIDLRVWSPEWQKQKSSSVTAASRPTRAEEGGSGNLFVPELAFGDLKRSTPGCFKNRPETEIKISMHDTFEKVFCAHGIFSFMAW